MSEAKQEWPLFEVFIRARSGLEHKHVGSIHAVDARMAIEHARDVYTRRQEGISIWVVRSSEIIASDPDRGRCAFRAGQGQGLPAPDVLRDSGRGQEPVSPAAAKRSASTASDTERSRYVLRLADTSLILGQRLGEWVGHAPALEEDLGLANLSLDLIGQARLLLTYAGELEGRGRDEDQLAFLRDGSDFFNVALAEQPNGDFGGTIVRQCLLDAWQLELYSELQHSTDRRLAEIAAKALKETQYHFRYSANWLVRLGDGTEESKGRVQSALDELWRFTAELFAPDALDEQMAAHRRRA